MTITIAVRRGIGLDQSMAAPPHLIDSVSDLAQLLPQLSSQRVLLVCGPSRRGLKTVQAHLSPYDVAVFDQARRHVPRVTLDAALQLARKLRSDTVITVGGGSAVGLGKMLKRELDLRLVAVPTTYAGSEWTNLYAVTDNGHKQTGRDNKVRPDAIVRDVELGLTMPLSMTVTSLFNALAHPLSLLSAGHHCERVVRRAFHAADRTLRAIERLVFCSEDRSARADAMAGAGACAQLLEEGELGQHHQLVHAIGGHFDLEHAALHALLLPHSVRQLREEQETLYNQLAEALGVSDLEALLFDLLVRAQAPLSLAELQISPSALARVIEQSPQGSRELLWAAYHGRRPSLAVRRLDWGLRHRLTAWGPEPDQAQRIVVALHGRGSNADAMLQKTLELTGNDPAVAVFSLQAPGNSWYSQRHTETRQQLGEEFSLSLDEVLRVLNRVAELARQVPMVLLGFSQGACLALEALVHFERPVSGLVALSGSGIGGKSEPPAFPPRLAGTRVLMGASFGDPWLNTEEIELTSRQLQQAGCQVQLEMVPGDAHTIHERHRLLARRILSDHDGDLTYGGFRGTVETESLPGALPIGRNNPRTVRYGLYAEQVNASGFTARDSENIRSWLYRLRPSAQHSPFEPMTHGTFRADFEPRPEVNLVGYAPLPVPNTPTDFVDGLHTLGGAGCSQLRRGFAVHVYSANRNMQDRSFCNADGELVILPQLGALTLLTECGSLEVHPGSLAILPRGIRFSVLLHRPEARGYVAEVYGRAFERVDRGPLGSNGLSESRDFRAPCAWHEDRLALNYRMTHKLGGVLYEARQDYSPYDVVAWHGNWAPRTYDLSCFSPVGNALFDHPDPSAHTVLTAPLDERGSHCLDLIAFVPRWDATQDTFRLPYFHRNATTELNGIIRSRSARSGFAPGALFLTPNMTPHGPAAAAAESAFSNTSSAANKPCRPASDSLWIQFESALPFRFTPWARQADIRHSDWQAIWGVHRTRFVQ